MGDFILRYQGIEQLTGNIIKIIFLNVEFDPDLSWDEKKEVYRISNRIVRTMNITQSAVGDKRGLWTTVLAAAFLLRSDD